MQPWVTVVPAYGTLLPGAVASISFRVRVNSQTMKGLGLVLGAGELDEVLVLRLERGREFYISLSITYMRSCFGMSIAEVRSCRI